jgi:hypothetical protein
MVKMRIRALRQVLFLVCACVVAVPSFAKYGVFGNRDVRIAQAEGCPVEIVPHRSQVMERTIVQAGRISGATPTGVFDFWTVYRNISDKPIAAVEFRWEGCNGMGECQWTRDYSEADKVTPGSKERASWSGPELGQNAEYFNLVVIRVKFSDGSMWEASKAIPGAPEGAPKP